jgi:hypothetical protein
MPTRRGAHSRGAGGHAEDSLTLLAVVALLNDMPAHGLNRGQVGTVVQAPASGAFEVESGDDAGRMHSSPATEVE